MKWLKAIPLVVLLVVATVALGFEMGSDHAAANTTDYSIDFDNAVGNIVVSPTSADIQVVLRPNSGAADDTMTVRSGDAMNWTNLPSIFVGVDIIRTSSTAVDVYWW